MFTLALYIVYILTILCSAVMACIYYKPLRAKGLFVLVIFLPLVFIQELALYLLDDVMKSSAIVYNIYRPITLIVFAMIYLRIPFMKPVKKLITGLSTAFLVITLCNYLLWEHLDTTGSYISLLRGFLVTLFGIIFLYYYFNLDNLSEEKYWRPLLWITIGIVTFYPVASISVAFQKFLSATESTLYGIKLYQLIPRLISIFMYSCFSYAFYLCQKKN